MNENKRNLTVTVLLTYQILRLSNHSTEQPRKFEDLQYLQASARLIYLRTYRQNEI